MNNNLASFAFSMLDRITQTSANFVECFTHLPRPLRAHLNFLIPRVPLISTPLVCLVKDALDSLRQAQINQENLSGPSHTIAIHRERHHHLRPFLTVPVRYLSLYAHINFLVSQAFTR